MTMKWCSVNNKMMLSMRAPTMQSWQWNKAVHEGNRLCGVDNKMMHCWQWNDAVHERTGLCSVEWCCSWMHWTMQCWMMLFMNALDYAVLTMKWCSVDNVNQMKLSMKALTMQCWQWNDVVLTIKWCSGDNEMMSMKALDDVVLTVK